MDDKFDNLDDPNITPDAVDTTAGDTFQEPGFDLSTSVPITLERDKKYAVQAIWKEGNGNDFCQVAWRKVGDVPLPRTGRGRLRGIRTVRIRKPSPVLENISACRSKTCGTVTRDRVTRRSTATIWGSVLG